MPYTAGSHSGEISEARKRLDQLDQQIIKSLKERSSFSGLVQSARIAEGGCRTDHQREGVIIRRYHDSLGPVGRDIAMSLLQLCRGKESSLSAAHGPERVRRLFLGPTASVSHHAAELMPGPDDIELIALDTLDEAMSGLLDGSADEAVVPLENSVSGPVHDTLLALADADELATVAHAYVPIDWVLAAAPGMPLATVETVASHPHALAQTQRWLSSLLPRTATVPTTSTSASAERLLQPDPGYEAVVCTRRAARHYRLDVLASPDAARVPVTRFALVRRVEALPPPSGNDVTSLALTMPSTSLRDVLECLAEAHAELLGLHTLPTGEASLLLWVDCRGHATDPQMVHLWSVLRERCDRLHMTGTCPAPGPGTSLAGA
ncbi:chorismate mutase [Streptomyces sp. NPDC055239]